MIVFPHSKINIGLNVFNRRSDGFHDIESLFYPLPFFDILEVVPAVHRTACSLKITGLDLDIPPENNLVTKAYRLIKDDYAIPGVDAILHKNLPAGAGLGGGSSDAAFMLKVVNELFDLKLSDESLHDYAAELGSDCSFFLSDKPALVAGRGDKYSPVSFSLEGYYLVLVLPGFHISTAWAFGQISAAASGCSLENELLKAPSEWQSAVLNDFEAPVFAEYPDLAKIKKLLYNCGADYASLTGTGAAIYGIFSSVPYDTQLKPIADIYSADYRLIRL